MGTENSANVILNGAQLVQQADKNFSNAVVQGFGAISQSFRDRSAMFQDMVKSTINLKQLEIDEWAKTENLKLQSRQLDIQESRIKADTEYRKQALDARANQEKKAASLAPLVSAVRTEADTLMNEQKSIQQEIEDQKMLLTGRFFDKDKGRNVIIAAGLRKGSKEYVDANNTISMLSNKLKESRDRGLKIKSAASQITAGIDPEYVLKDLYPQAPLKENQPFYYNQEGTQGGPNPLLPPIDDGMGSGQIPQENYPSPKEEEVDAFEKFGTKPGPLRSKELMPPVVEEYDSLDQYQMIVGELIAQSDEKNPFNINIAREYESRLAPKDREQLNQDRKVTQKDAFVSIGEVLASRYGNGTYTDQEKVIERKIEMYKGQMLSLGEDPAKIDLAVRKADLAIIKFRQSESSDDPLVRTRAIVGHLEAVANKEYGEPIKEAPPPQGVVSKKLNEKGEVIDSPSLYSPDGSISLDIPDEKDMVSETKNAATEGLRREFEKEFLKGPDDKNPYAVNNKYIEFLNDFNFKPEAFNISKKELEYSGTIDVMPEYKEIDDKIIKARIVARKREIANDPDRAFYFWLDQKYPDRAKDVEGYGKYKEERKFVNEGKFGF